MLINIIGKVLIALAILAFHPANAQEIEYGQGLVCDHADQVAQYLNIVNGDPQAAVERVNAEAKDPTACLLTTVAFIRGKALARVRNNDGAWKVTEILVVGVITGRGFQVINPHPYFSAFKIEEQPA